METSRVYQPDAPSLLIEWEPRRRAFQSSLRAALAPGSGRPFIATGARLTSPSTSILLHLLLLTLVLNEVFHMPGRPRLVPAAGWNLAQSQHAPVYYVPDLPPSDDASGAATGRAGFSGGAEAYSKQNIRISTSRELTTSVANSISLPKSPDPTADVLLQSRPRLSPRAEQQLTGSPAPHLLPASSDLPRNLLTADAASEPEYRGPVREISVRRSEGPRPDVATPVLSADATSLQLPSELLRDPKATPEYAGSVRSVRDIKKPRMEAPPETPRLQLRAEPLPSHLLTTNSNSKAEYSGAVRQVRGRQEQVPPATVSAPTLPVPSELESSSLAVAGDLLRNSAAGPDYTGRVRAVSETTRQVPTARPVTAPQLQAAGGAEGSSSPIPGALLKGQSDAQPEYSGPVRSVSGARKNSGGTDSAPPANVQLASAARPGSAALPGLLPPGRSAGQPQYSGLVRGVSRTSGAKTEAQTAAAPPSLGSKDGIASSELAAVASGGLGTSGTGFVVSVKPGTAVGVNERASAGTLAMTPKGTDAAGAGGAGSKPGTGTGSGTGSGAVGVFEGLSVQGSGRGSDPNARNGVEGRGPGGAGDGAPSTGIKIAGNNVYLPSFTTGTPSAASHSPAAPQRNDVVVIATPSAMGGPRQGLHSLNVATVYTIYLQTGGGVAVMQYGQAASRQNYDQELQAPQALDVQLPAGLEKARLVVRCVLDVFGQLKQLQPLESNDARSPAQLMQALKSWRFRPAERNSQPVEIDVILGFGGATN